MLRQNQPQLTHRLEMDLKTSKTSTERHRELYRMRRMRNECPLCGKDPIPGHVHCGYHDEMLQDKYRKRMEKLMGLR